MRMMLLAISAIGLATAGAAAAAPRGDTNARASKCPDEPAAHHAYRGKSAKHHKLTDLPPAEAYRAVYRRGPDGCIVPVKFNDRAVPPRR